MTGDVEKTWRPPVVFAFEISCLIWERGVGFHYRVLYFLSLPVAHVIVWLIPDWFHQWSHVQIVSAIPIQFVLCH